ncbi:hypothetical protein F5884DRAFT_898552 [Xylogone sp. PMI_703]|nr:hypothetical protein F5884DRAFT_898552 [Xylogone sp. PMI_703]
MFSSNVYAAVPNQEQGEQEINNHGKRFSDGNGLVRHDNDSIKSAIDRLDEYSGCPQDKRKRKIVTVHQRLLFIILAVNMAIFIAAMGLTIILTRGIVSQYRDQCVNEQLLGVAEIPVEMELYRFRTGVPEKTAFFGVSNASTDAAWNTILDAGLVQLTQPQADKLSAPTARNPTNPTSYVGMLEVFHQLHCLHTIRRVVYSSDEAFISDQSGHIAHCFEYLRQTLMCLADVHIAPISWNEKKRQYAIHHDTVRQCRNFEKIHLWAVDEAHYVSEEVE